MLLRRVIEHVKTQNWTAVALDFVIVVVGVFIGIQVSNWNDARADRALEREYLERLHDEAEASLGGLLSWAAGYMRPRFAAYQEIVEQLDAAPGDFTLSDLQCDVIGNMHDYIAFPTQFPSLDEMTASGEFHLIRDADLRQALINYRLMKDQAKVLINNLNTELTVLPNEFPDYFEATLTNDAPGRELSYRNCNSAAMAGDRSFLNRFADTASRYNQYYNIVVAQERSRVEQLHALLDEKLGVSHQEAE